MQHGDGRELEPNCDLSQDARKVVGVWEAEFLRAPNPQKKMALLYLANDILQNSRKKGPEYVHEFFRVLPRQLQQLLKHGDDKVGVRNAARRRSSNWGLALCCCSPLVLQLKSGSSNLTSGLFHVLLWCGSSD